jgi:ADP-heptose:LPS heptosyltransferase
MGDTLALQPLIAQLHSCGLEVIPVVKPQWQQLIPDAYVHARINCCVPWAAYERKDKYRIDAYCKSSFRNLMSELKATGAGSIGIDPRGDIRSIFLLNMAGCTKIYSAAYYVGSDLKIPRGVSELIELPRDTVRWKQLLSFAQRFHCQSSSEPPSLYHLTSTGSSKTCSRVQNRIALLPVANRPGRLWPAKNWQQLLGELQKRELIPLLLCGPGEKQNAETLLGDCIEATECRSINQWINALQSCETAVSVNTGPMHLVDAMRIPQVVITGSSSLPTWGPSWPESESLNHHELLKCAPCHETGNYCRNGYACINAVEVDEVVGALDRILMRLEDFDSDAQ